MPLIHKKLPPGHIYPQITQAPVNNYADFLNFFRGGHTFDDNLTATYIASTHTCWGHVEDRHQERASFEDEEHCDVRAAPIGF